MTSVHAAQALTCIATRRSVPRLVEPAPDEATTLELLQLATTAPDHGRLQPWRFIVVRAAARERLGAVFAAAHAAREPGLDAAARRKTAGKPLRAPLIVVVVSAPVDHPKIPRWEQRYSAACVAHALCLGAHGRGFGAMWRTGWYGEAPLVRDHLGLTRAEQVAGWIYLGSVPAGQTLPPRPAVDVVGRTVVL